MCVFLQSREHNLPPTHTHFQGKRKSRDETGKRLSSARRMAVCAEVSRFSLFLSTEGWERKRKRIRRGSGEGGGLCKFKLRRVKRDSPPTQTILSLLKWRLTFTWFWKALTWDDFFYLYAGPSSCLLIKVQCSMFSRGNDVRLKEIYSFPTVEREAASNSRLNLKGKFGVFLT